VSNLLSCSSFITCRAGHRDPEWFTILSTADYPIINKTGFNKPNISVELGDIDAGLRKIVGNCYWRVVVGSLRDLYDLPGGAIYRLSTQDLRRDSRRESGVSAAPTQHEKE
jgi:hypothetical protein